MRPRLLFVSLAIFGLGLGAPLFAQEKQSPKEKPAAVSLRQPLRKLALKCSGFV